MSLFTGRSGSWRRALGGLQRPEPTEDGTQSDPSNFTICPVKDWEDRQAGTYRLIGHMTILTDTDSVVTGIPTYEDTVTGTFRSPTFNNKPGGSPAQDASFSSLQSGLLDAAQPSRVSLRSLALPGPRFRPPPAAEARAASRVAQMRASHPRDAAPPRIHPITRDRVPAAAMTGQPAETDLDMSCRHGRM